MRLVRFFRHVATNPVETIIHCGAAMLIVFDLYLFSPLYVLSTETVDGILVEYGTFSLILKLLYVVPLIPWSIGLIVHDRLKQMLFVQWSALLMAVTYMFILLSRFILIGVIPTTWVWQFGVIVVLSICYLAMTEKIRIYKSIKA